MSVALLAPNYTEKNGIAVYSKNLSEEMDFDSTYIGLDIENFNFCEAVKTIQNLDLSSRDAVHIQYSDALFPPGILGNITHSGQFTFLYLLFLLYLMSKLYNTKIIITIHELKDPDAFSNIKSLYLRAQHQFMGLCSDEIIVLSDKVEHRYSGESTNLPHGVPKSLVASTPSAEAKDHFNINPDRQVIILPGYIYERKGTDVFIDIAREDPERLYLVAGGDTDGEGTEFANSVKNRAPSNVKFTGVLNRDQYHLAFEAADLAVLPYREIHQSGVVNDCVAHSLPVVATALPHFNNLSGVVTVDVDIPSSKDYPSGDWKHINNFSGQISEAIRRRDELTECIKSLSDENSLREVVNEYEELYGSNK